MRIVELPFYFCTGQNLPLAVLIHRTDAVAVSHEIHLGESYDFSGTVAPATYQQLTAHNRFAQHGSLMVDYPSDTLTIDREIGLTVQLDGIDTTLEEQSAFNALADEFLVFVGDEICSVISWTLIAAKTYRLNVIRERMGTPRQAHAAEAEVYLIALKDLLPLTHRSFLVENEIHFKVVTLTGSYAQDLSEVDAVTHTITGRVFTQSVPMNLQVQGSFRNPNYSAGTDLKLRWSQHELRQGIVALFGVKIRTLVEIVSLVDEELLYSKLTFGEFFKIEGAKMTTILGGETSFIVRLSSHILGSNLFLQSATIQLTVTPP